MAIKSLKVYPSINQALNAINKLENDFVKEHKRKLKVSLTLATISSPFDRSKKRVPTSESAEVRVHYESHEITEVSWLEKNI